MVEFAFEWLPRIIRRAISSASPSTLRSTARRQRSILLHAARRRLLRPDAPISSRVLVLAHRERPKLKSRILKLARGIWCRSPESSCPRASLAPALSIFDHLRRQRDASTCGQKADKDQEQVGYPLRFDIKSSNLNCTYGASIAMESSSSHGYHPAGLAKSAPMQGDRNAAR